MSDAFHHIKMIHDLAAGIDGKLILASYGEDSTGENILPKVQHFKVGEYEAMTKCAKKWSQEPRRNVYMPLAVMQSDLKKNRKGGEEDVIAILGFVVDFDGGRGKDWDKRLHRDILPQYVLETSPDNAQCFFLFDNPTLIKSTSDRKNSKSALEKLTSSCKDADPSGAELSHVWRIPGLLNYPNQKKIKQGRDPAPCIVKIKKDWEGDLISPSIFEKLHDLPREISDQAEKLDRKPIGDQSLTADPKLIKEALSYIPNSKDDERTEIKNHDDLIPYTAAIKAALAGNKEHYRIFHDWVSQWDENTEKYIRKRWDSIHDSHLGAAFIFKQAEKFGWVNPEPEWVTEFNHSHFVAPDGKDTYAFQEMDDPVFDGRRMLRCLAFSGLKKLHDNQQIRMISNNAQKFIGSATAWLRHPKRRTYINGLVFSPNRPVPEGYYNLWRGFGVSPIEGSWALMQHHLLHVLCDGNKEAYDYLIGWMAHAVQHPDQQGSVAIVIYGGKGVGKNTFGTYFSRIFGQHSLYINNSKHLTGSFNAHLRDAVLVILDEAFFAGDKQADSVLKSLITEEMLPIEGKGKDLIQCRNYTHIIMFSNSDWVIRASSRDERRYFVLHIPEERKQGKDYFDALYSEMNNGGPAAMLYDLQKYDLTNFNLRSIPQTHALAEQKIRSLDPPMRWLYNCLYEGYIGNNAWQNERFTLMTQGAHEDYVHHHKEHSFDGKPLMASMWSKTVRNVLFKNDQPLITDGGKPTIFGDRHPHTSFPSLLEAREAFNRYINFQIIWPEIDCAEFTLDDMLE